MRGALTNIASGLPESWIIPADAGSTQSPVSVAWVSPDHPRGCGEHGRSVVALFSHAGSSPRMRGARGLRTIKSAVVGIIPADAGSTDNPRPQYKVG